MTREEIIAELNSKYPQKLTMVEVNTLLEKLYKINRETNLRKILD